MHTSLRLFLVEAIEQAGGDLRVIHAEAVAAGDQVLARRCVEAAKRRDDRHIARKYRLLYT